MPYGLKDEDFDKIQNEIVRKLYEIPSLDRATFLVGCTEQELREAMTELRKTPKSRGKIEAVERELRNRGNKNKKTKFFPSDLAEKRFAREWTKACGRIRGGMQKAEINTAVNVAANLTGVILTKDWRGKNGLSENL